MKASKFTESQIMAFLKLGANGIPVAEICREHGISSALYYRWRSRYVGMDATLISRLKELERENAHLKRMYAEERLEAEIVQEALSKKF